MQPEKNQQPSTEITKTRERSLSLSRYVQKLPLTDSEKKVVALKYQSPQIGEIRTPDLSKHCKALLLKIHAITGWTLPASDLANVVMDQFEKHLQEKYPSLNVDEIEYAFRSKGTIIEDWGKSLNLNLIDKVLLPYLNERFELAQIEQQVDDSKPKADTTVEIKDWKGSTEACYQEFLSGKYTLALWPWQCYQELVDAKYIAADLYTDFLKEGKEIQVSLAHKKVMEAERLEQNTFALQLRIAMDHMIKSVDITQSTEQSAKVLAMKFLFSCAKVTGYKNLFIQEKPVT